MILDPITLGLNSRVGEALQLMRKYSISGVPIIDDNNLLVGIVKADHIAEGYEKIGISEKEAERRAWATVNKQDGGGKNPGGSGRKGA